jgi:chemotaxis protein MotB
MYGRSGSFKNVQGKLNIDAHSIGFGLLVNISKKQQPAAAVESVQLMELKKELEVNSQKVKELEASARQVDVLEEQVIAKEEEIVAKKEEIRSLKESISNALLAFEGKGLTIIEREGKVYVTMETDMLFQSGSWNIGAEGEKAVNALGNVLADNPDVTVLIEGHTDNEPFKGSGNINNNWDLSTKRATAIVEILRNNKKINPKNLTAAGRGEYDPVADNATIEGKAKNRRIEVIITPKLDEVFKLIKK